jgi:hypothetical protein
MPDRQRGLVAAGEPSRNVIDPALPASQSLERGSSVTHNSLEANQRPHISLIDRRHFDHAALPIRLYVKRKRCVFEAEGIVHPLTTLSHINVPVLARGARRGATRLTRRCPCPFLSGNLPDPIRASPQAYCARPWPRDQFSFATSTRLTNTSSGRMPGLSPSSSAIRRNSAFFCSTVRVLFAAI